MPPPRPPRRVLPALRRLRTALARMDLACAGTIYVRTRKCGKRTCRCHEDPAARHGPYAEWTRVREGRLVHSTLSAEQAELLAAAIGDYREIRRLLARWERETEKVILSRSRRKSRSRRQINSKK